MELVFIFGTKIKAYLNYLNQFTFSLACFVCVFLSKYFSFALSHLKPVNLRSVAILRILYSFSLCCFFYTFHTFLKARVLSEFFQQMLRTLFFLLSLLVPFLPFVLPHHPPSCPVYILLIIAPCHEHSSHNFPDTSRAIFHFWNPRLSSSSLLSSEDQTKKKNDHLC